MAEPSKKMPKSRTAEVAKSGGTDVCKSVKFNPRTIETSFGGTHHHGKIHEASVVLFAEDNNLAKTKSDLKQTSQSERKKSVLNNNKLQSEAVATPPAQSKKRSSDTAVKHPSKSHVAENATTPKTQRGSATKQPTPLKTPRVSLADPLARPAVATPDCFNPVAIETPVPKAKRARSSVHGLADDVFKQEDDSEITVAVRVRPFNQR